MFRIAVPLAALCLAAPLRAELPAPVRAMIDAAIATGNAEKIATVVEIAKQTNPADVAEIKAMHDVFLTRLAERKAEEATAKAEAARTAGFFERWEGEGQIGAFYADGNNSNIGVTGTIELEREGVDWSHRLRARGDYQRSNGRTTREQYLAAYEPRYDIDEGLFAYGLLQYESDRFQGFDSRQAVSGGLGYQLLDSDGLKLSVKAGPAYRRTVFLSGEAENSLAGLVGLDFDWQIADGLTLTQDTNMVAEAAGSATVIIDSSNTTLNLVTALRAKISDRVSTRLSYTVDYNSNPAPGAVSTDTLSRFTIVYGF